MTLTPDLLEIAPDLHRLRIPGGAAHLLNSYLWVGPESVTLFDVGWPDSAVQIEAALRALGRRRDDVGKVLLSHFHEDHAGAAAEIAEWPHAVIVAGAVEADAVRGTDPGEVPVLTLAERAIHEQPSTAPRAPACRVDVDVVDGDVLPIAGEAVVIHTPGHTPGSIALHLPHLDAVLTGDTVAELHGEVIVGVFDVDRDLTHRSTRLLAATGAGVAGFGHGEAVLTSASDRIALARDPFADRASR